MRLKSLLVITISIAVSLVISPIYVLGQSQFSNAYVNAFPYLLFDNPVGIINDNITNKLYIIEQAGIIKVFNNSPNTTAVSTFLDISDRVTSGGEQGLLGLAFHPNFRQNGYFYVNYITSNPLRTIVARYSAQQNNLEEANKNSELIILTVNQPFSNHNGGQLAFGPDGYLYIGLGDGGSAGDPFSNGQNRSTLLGKILRINVDQQSNGRNYGIPPDNPFLANTQGYREEIYAYGFRNPWRFSFDFVANNLWVGDVGQDRLEEIDLVMKGKNYGWNIMEGNSCYNQENCNQTGLELPVWNYTRDEGDAVIGGYIYHGQALSRLANGYIYGDYGSGRIWMLNYNGTAVGNTLITDTGLNISSFGLDLNGELYFCALDGKIYKLNPEVIPEESITLMFILIIAVSMLVILLKKPLKKR